MIKINLALRKQPASVTGDVRGGGAAGSALGFLAGMRVDQRLDGFKDLPLKKFALMALVAVMGGYLLDDFKEGELSKIDALLAKDQEERRKLEGDLGKTKGFEAVKKALDADELTLRTKIDTIQKLLTDRQIPPKMLTTLSASIPADVWLRSFKVKDDEISIRGSSLDYNAISDFMKGLNESAYFTDIQLKGTQQERDELGADVAAFELFARRR